MRDYEELTLVTITRMMKKLRQNEHKGSLDLNLNEAFRLLLLEVEELRIEINGRPMIEPLDFDAIADEAADIANFAAMIILYCEKRRTDEHLQRNIQEGLGRSERTGNPKDH